MKIQPGKQIKTSTQTRLSLGVGIGAFIVLALLVWAIWPQENKAISDAVEHSNKPRISTEVKSTKAQDQNRQQTTFAEEAGSSTQSQNLKRLNSQTSSNKQTIQQKTQSLARWGGIQFDFSNAVGKLSWKLDMMRFGDEFTIESSLDNKTFRPLGKQKVGTNLDYTFLDHEVAYTGMPSIYYRLKLKGLDGQVFYSPVKKFEMPIRIGVYGFVEVQQNQVGCFYAADQQGQLDLRIENEDGKIIHQGIVTANRNAKSQWLDAKSWLQGNYTLLLSNEEIEFRTDFVLQDQY